MIPPFFRSRTLSVAMQKEQKMTVLTSISFDQLLVSLMATIAIREILIILLPDSIAGPEGWLIRLNDTP